MIYFPNTSAVCQVQLWVDLPLHGFPVECHTWRGGDQALLMANGLLPHNSPSTVPWSKF